jgi:hypothetical protein
VGHHAPAEADDLLHVRLRTGSVDRPDDRSGAPLLPGRARARRPHADDPGLPAGPGCAQLLHPVIQGDRGVVRGDRAACRLRAGARARASAVERGRHPARRRAPDRADREGGRSLSTRGQPLLANITLTLRRGETVLLGGRRARERARSSGPSPASGRSGVARSSCRRMAASSFSRSGRTCPSAPSGTW